LIEIVVIGILINFNHKIFNTLQLKKGDLSVKKRPILILVFAFVFCLSIGAAQAATVSIMPPTQEVVQGGAFSISLAYDFPEAILGGGVSIGFDDTVLNLGTFAWNPTFFALLDPSTSKLPTDNSNGTIGALDGWDFGNFGGVGPGTGTIGTVNFQVDPLAALGLTDLSMAVSTSSGGWFDAAGAPITPTLNGATVNVNVVPIPGSILLLGSGLVGLIGLVRRKRS
jgi:hypothetical protein